MRRNNRKPRQRTIEAATDREAALKWELKRLRREVATLRKARHDPDDRQGERLTPDEEAAFYATTANLVRNILVEQKWSSACAQCGSRDGQSVHDAILAWSDVEVEKSRRYLQDCADFQASGGWAARRH